MSPLLFPVNSVESDNQWSLQKERRNNCQLSLKCVCVFKYMICLELNSYFRKLKAECSQSISWTHRKLNTTTATFRAWLRWLPTRADLSRGIERELWLEAFGNLLWVTLRIMVVPWFYKTKTSCTGTYKLSHTNILFKKKKTLRNPSSFACTVSGVQSGRNNARSKSLTFNKGNVFFKMF